MLKPVYIKAVIVLAILNGFPLRHISAGNINFSGSGKKIEKRRSKELLETVQGIIFYLYDRQIIDRKGKRNCFYDATRKGDGALDRDEFNFAFLPPLYIKVRPDISIKNFEGEWSTGVHFLYRRLGFKGKSVFAVYDSNLFTSIFITYPFFLFRENSPRKPLTEMLKKNWFIYKNFKRGKAYNFWPRLDRNPLFVAPANISIDRSVPLAYSYANPHHKFIWKRITRGLDFPGPEWIYEILDTVKNPYGIDMFFNIPDDADDTGGEIAVQKIKTQLRGCYPQDDFFRNPDNFFVDTTALEQFQYYRDINRQGKKDDPRNYWKEKNSGAFFTWLKHDTLPLFSQPEKGEIPLGYNNVDAVVNANILLALGLMNRKDYPGYHDAARLLLISIEKHSWPDCALYYPNTLIFPYSVSRAYRDGNNGVLRDGMKKLLKDVLKLQHNYYKNKRKNRGAFPGGIDNNDYLSTALGLSTLLNIGIDIAKEEGLEKEYSQTVDNAVQYLIKNRKKAHIKNKDAFSEFTSVPEYSYRWSQGIFFSSSYKDLAVWRSEAYTNAMVLEALAKYILGYDYDTGTNIMTGKRIYIKKYNPGKNGKPELDIH